MNIQVVQFVGDSVTDCGRDRSDAASLGNGYVSLIAERLGEQQNVRVVNVGNSGERAIDLQNRWADVLAEKPGILSILIGINDTWRRYDSDDPTSAEAFEASCRDLLERAARGGDVPTFLLEPFVVPVTAGQAAWFEDLGPKQLVVRKLATKFGATFIPLQDYLGGYPASEVAADGVHPTPFGHSLIADRWLEVVSAQGLLTVV